MVWKSLSTISITLLYFVANLISSVLLATTIGFYFFIYTIWLKRRTPQNIVIGGALELCRQLLDGRISTNAVSLNQSFLFLIIFIWTPSHFWALSLYKSDDYKKAKIPMLPLTNGIESTKINILVYSLVMAPIVALPYFFDFGSLTYLVLSSLMTLYYIYLCYLLLIEKNNKNEYLLLVLFIPYFIYFLYLF